MGARTETWEQKSGQLAALMGRLPEIEGKKLRLKRAADARVCLEFHYKAGYAQREGDAEGEAALRASEEAALCAGGFASIDEARGCTMGEELECSLRREVAAFEDRYRKLFWECERLDRSLGDESASEPETEAGAETASEEVEPEAVGR